MASVPVVSMVCQGCRLKSLPPPIETKYLLCQPEFGRRYYVVRKITTVGKKSFVEVHYESHDLEDARFAIPGGMSSVKKTAEDGQDVLEIWA